MIRIDHSSKIPPFEQLRAQLALMVSSGRLRPGNQLPTIRELAAQLGLANGTVARAYRELEYAGIVHGRGRLGTFVADEPPVAFPVIERRRRLAEAAEAFAVQAAQLGSDKVAALEAAEQALDQVDAGAV